jgi:methyl-accepting chemotaxis protein
MAATTPDSQTQTSRFWRFGLAPQIILLSVSGILVLGICVTWVANYVLERGATEAARERVDTNMRVAWDVLRANGTHFSLRDGKLHADERVLNGDTAVVDKVKSLVGGTCTIFMQDQRVATNVVKHDGSRAIGTTLAKTNAYTAIFDRKASYRGEVEILGEPYMTAYDPILGGNGELLGILYVGMKKADFLRSAHQTLWTIILATVIVALLAALASFMIARGVIVRPLKLAIATMNRLARGDLTIETPNLSRRDEIGEIINALGVFKTNGLEIERLKREQQEAEARAEAERKAAMHRLADDFEGAIGEIVDTVTSASVELEASAATLSGNAERSETLATAVAAASEEASTNVQSVASATEEMSSSVHEISRQVQGSAKIANDAVDQARKTNANVAELSQMASRIGDVVELINTIAGQTNLLALNATIEAARAGEAGRGFAVVASEVKALAEQTAKATGEIGQQIGGIQTATRNSVDTIREISETIARMSEISSTIASAVEEQGAATQEISRNIQQAAVGTSQVSEKIVEVERDAGETGRASGQVHGAAKRLSTESERLKSEVGRFLQSVRAA